ncbi:MAG: DUF115 domain-containing protein [Spirochaetales bacterium]|nr:DUF115 domain-containing protein [Spirochaetales bacterium]
MARIPESSAILCVEADAVLLELARDALKRAVPEARDELRLVSPEETIDAYRILESSRQGRRFRRVIELRLSAGRALADGVYDDTLDALRQTLSTRYRNRVALVRMGRLWTRNTIANLSAMRWQNIRQPARQCKPVVVCGAGPSLDTTMPLIRRYRDSLYVLACDTASGALARAGINPDAVVCLEGQVYNVQDFLPLESTTTRLFADLSAHPSSFRATTGPVTLLLSEWAESSFLSRLATSGLPLVAVPPLGSVGVLAIHVAKMLGEHIFVAGLDFAFSPGKTHCAGSPSDIRERGSETRTRKHAVSWAASYRDGVTRLQTARVGSGLVTDPALSMYASLAAHELRGSHTYDLRGGYGTPLPIPLASEDTLRELIATTASDCRELVDSGDYRASRTDYAALARAFLAGELVRVESIASILSTGADSELLPGLLSETDLLYAHFPDPERVLLLERDALKRVAVEAAYWRGKLGAAIDSFDSSQ